MISINPEVRERLPEKIPEFNVDLKTFITPDTGSILMPTDFEYKMIDHVCNGKPMSNMNEFIAVRQEFESTGKYTSETPARVSTSKYTKFWEREIDRCINGYNAGYDSIPGYYYWYLNYSPIIKVEKIASNNKTGKSRGKRVVGFADIWDSDYLWFHYLEEAEKRGQHAANIKSRGKGYSWKAASMLNRNFYLIPNSKSYAVAADWGYLTGKDGMLLKAWEQQAFIDSNTEFRTRKLVDTTTTKESGYIIKNTEGIIIKKGLKSSIIGISLNNNADSIRGIRGKLILFEESGNNPVLNKTWAVARSSVEQDSVTYGLMIAFGCACKGTKVWTRNGNLKNIEDLLEDDGIMGYDGYNVAPQTITYTQPEAYKECLKITFNNGTFIECSNDHPLLVKGRQLTIRENGVRRTTYDNDYIEASEVKIGARVAIIDKVEIFGDNKINNPRLIGWLIGDGSYGEGQTPKLHNCEEEINNYVKENYNYTLYEGSGHITKLGKSYEVHGIREFIDELRELGIYGQTKTNKRLPEIIYSCDKETVSELIGGLFDTDGYVHYRKNKSRENSYLFEVSISQSSIELLEQLKLLLVKFGVHGNIRKREPRKSNPIDRNAWYELVISDQISIERFQHNIKLFPKEKQKRLNEIVEICKTRKPLYNVDEGLRYVKVVKIEDIGIQRIYNLTAKENNNYLINNIVSHNTGGSEGARFEALNNMIRHPEHYNIYGVPNIFETGRFNTKTAFFVGDYMNKEEFYDKKTGTSDILGAIIEEVKQREVLRGNPRMLRDRQAEHPINIEEATLQMDNNTFDVPMIRKQIAELETNRDLNRYTQYGFVKIDTNGKARFEVDMSARYVDNFPTTDREPEGCVAIYEHPKVIDGNVPFGIYIAGTDPVDFDRDEVKNTYSLASTFVMNVLTGNIVAEYTGRTKNINTYFENLKNLLIYYNARSLYEGNIRGLYVYFTNNKAEHLLAPEPKILRDSLQYTGAPLKKGYKANAKINAFNRQLLNTWSTTAIETVDKDGNTNIKYRMEYIRSKPLLQEMAEWSVEGNFDRVSAMGALLLYHADMEKSLGSSAKSDYDRVKDAEFWNRAVGYTKKTRTNIMGIDAKGNPIIQYT